jgi:hypothetical protein
MGIAAPPAKNFEYNKCACNHPHAEYRKSNVPDFQQRMMPDDSEYQHWSK